jgi:EAL domain-containing protein (putative c-di-GMP-specific phosphodiesterase class I)
VGEWVVGEACRQLAAWSGPEMGHVYVSANLSARQIGPELPRLVADALDATGIDPSRLWLELTETAFMADLQVSERVLHEVRDLGVHLVVDDFGTGYSSLAYLKRFPVEVVKIDQVFVRGLGLDRDDTAIVAAVIGVAHALGLRAVAEGVETEEQLAALRALDCDFAQGYYFARPQPALEAMRASASWRADPGA